MPSLVLTGHPCTGKTTFAHLLADRALRHPSNLISNIIHISESTACPDTTKAECYRNSHNEKATRAGLKSEFDRAVMSSNNKHGSKKQGSTLVILDSLNYIKGYRYELYCISKAAGESHGVVWVMGSGADEKGLMEEKEGSESDGLAKKRNRERKELQLLVDEQKGVTDDDQKTIDITKSIDLDGYFEDDATMDALVLRYEPPDDKNRWENPLYKVDVTKVLPWGKDGTLEKSSNAVTALDSSSTAVEGLANDMKAIEIKNEPVKIEPSKPAKKSASGFKRSKKSIQQRSAPKSQPKQSNDSESANVLSGMSIQAAPNVAISNDQNANSSPAKMEDVIDNILNSFLMNVKPLKEGQSTFTHVSAESNALNQVDNITQCMNNEILKAQKAASLSTGVGGKIFVPLGGSSGKRHVMSMSKPLYVNELRNFRRQFLKWIAGHPVPDGTKEEEMAELYVSYIETHI